jgi:hypothetical protein
VDAKFRLVNKFAELSFLIVGEMAPMTSSCDEKFECGGQGNRLRSKYAKASETRTFFPARSRSLFAGCSF